MVDEDLVRSYTGAPHFVGSWLNSPFSDDTIRHGRSFLNASAFRAGESETVDETRLSAPAPLLSGSVVPVVVVPLQAGPAAQLASNRRERESSTSRKGGLF